jgi:hypothetical protein
VARGKKNMSKEAFQTFIDGELPKLKSAQNKGLRINIIALCIGAITGIALHYGLDVGNLWINIPVAGVLAFLSSFVIAGSEAEKILQSLTDRFAALSSDDQCQYLAVFWQANGKHYGKAGDSLSLTDMTGVFCQLFWGAKCWSDGSVEERVSVLLSTEVKENALRWVDAEKPLIKVISDAAFNADALLDFLTKFYEKYNPSKENIAALVDASAMEGKVSLKEQGRLLSTLMDMNEKDDKWRQFFSQKYPLNVFDAARLVQRFEVIAKEHGIALVTEPKQWSDEYALHATDFLDLDKLPFAIDRVFLGLTGHVSQNFSAWLAKNRIRETGIRYGARPSATSGFELLFGKNEKGPAYIQQLEEKTEGVTKKLSDEYDVMEQNHRNTDLFVATYDAVLQFNDDFSELTVLRVAVSGRYKAWADSTYKYEGVTFVIEDRFSETALLDSKMEFVG